MDSIWSMTSLGAIPVDNLATLAGPAVVFAAAYWYIRVHGFIYATGLAWTVIGVLRTILTVPFRMVYWVISSILMIPYYLLMVVFSPVAWIWHAFMAPFHWFMRFLGDPYPVIVFFGISILIGLCSGLIISLISAIASSFIHQFASSIRPSPRNQKPPTVVPTDLNTTMSAAANTSRENARDSRPSKAGFVNPLALHPVSSPSPRSSRFNPYDADNELVHIEYPNLSDTNSPTTTTSFKQQRSGGGSSFFDQQRSPKSIPPPHGPSKLHARPRSAVSVKRGLVGGLSAAGGVSATTLLRETIHEEEDSGFSDDSV